MTEKKCNISDIFYDAVNNDDFDRMNIAFMEHISYDGLR